MYKPRCKTEQIFVMMLLFPLSLSILGCCHAGIDTPTPTSSKVQCSNIAMKNYHRFSSIFPPSFTKGLPASSFLDLRYFADGHAQHLPGKCKPSTIWLTVGIIRQRHQIHLTHMTLSVHQCLPPKSPVGSFDCLHHHSHSYKSFLGMV